MTHEFRTPISTILLSSDVLKDPAIITNSERLGNYAKIIKEESNRLLNQVENILQSTIIEERKTNLQLETLDTHVLIDDVVESFQLLRGKNIIICNFMANQSFIKADKIHFSNAIKNLVDNAIKYSTEDPEITINTKNHQHQLYIEILDKGIGIEKAYHKKVFQKFYCIPTGNRHDIKGFGIGLHYVKNIVKLHKGRITLDSHPGIGSKFTLTFPIENEK
jgi:two-component system phosphate regulon sensor histidine kinase PhoR